MSPLRPWATHRDVALLISRTVVGSYLAAHGAQKLFGSFGGSGIDAAAAGFERLGLRPGWLFARVASVSELAGGMLTVAGAADPVGPVVLVGTMLVASSTHRKKGPFTARGGYELPLTNLAAALALAVAGPGRLSVDGLLGLRVTGRVVRSVMIGAAAVSTASLGMVLLAES